MSDINHQPQDGKYGQLARKLLKIASLSNSKVVLSRSNQPSDTVTEFVHEYGTTDIAIGDVTAEVMITTLGKIPNEMYYLEDTSCVSKVTVAPHFAHAAGVATEMVYNIQDTNNEDNSGHSSILLILLIILLIILLLCCISACLIAKTKRKSSFFDRSDTECDPRCTGVNQPLLDKISDCTHKTSICSLRN